MLTPTKTPKAKNKNKKQLTNLQSILHQFVTKPNNPNVSYLLAKEEKKKKEIILLKSSTTISQNDVAKKLCATDEFDENCAARNEFDISSTMYPVAAINPSSY